MTTRTALLALDTLTIAAATNPTIYTVPAGRVTIIRSTIIHNRGAATATFEERTRVGAQMRAMRALSLATLAVDTYEVWRVLEAGDELILRNTGASNISLSYWVSGAELVA